MSNSIVRSRQNTFPASVLRTAIAVAAWIAATVGGLVLLQEYSTAPGKEHAPVGTWPEQSSIPHHPGVPQLVMFAHPHCPCTRASLSELGRLLTGCQVPIDTHVRFVKLAGSSDDWTKTDLWGAARAISGIDVAVDADGREARLFGAATSGHTLVYDGDGRLLFSGGITAARGHEGDNAGRSAIVELLKGRQTGHVRTPVFGCSLSGRREGS